MEHGTVAGRGGTAITYLSPDGRHVVKVPCTHRPTGRPCRLPSETAATRQFKHEAVVVARLRAMGFGRFVAETTYVEVRGTPALVREAGLPIPDETMTGGEFLSLVDGLRAIERAGFWLEDEIEPMRRRNGSVFVADVAEWRMPGHRRKSRLDLLLHTLLGTKVRPRALLPAMRAAGL